MKFLFSFFTPFFYLLFFFTIHFTEKGSLFFPPFPEMRYIVYYFKKIVIPFLFVDKNRRPLDSRMRSTTSTKFDLKFFHLFSKYRLSRKVHLPFFTTKVITVTFSEGGYTLSQSQNDQTPNICYLVFATTTFSLKLVVEWWWLPHFPPKMTLVHRRVLLSTEKIFYTLSYSS